MSEHCKECGFAVSAHNDYDRAVCNMFPTRVDLEDPLNRETRDLIVQHALAGFPGDSSVTLRYEATVRDLEKLVYRLERDLVKAVKRAA